MSQKKVNVFTHAKEIRLAGETWKDAVSRATQELYGHPAKAAAPRRHIAYRGKTKSECSGLAQDACNDPCHWIASKKRTPHCAVKRVGSKKAKSISQAVERTFPEF
uniref:Uncharacterized protein n=1 Tax=viral metagenome TaxID=1070528 RepID=A0A6C0BKN5_9ZZZZ